MDATPPSLPASYAYRDITGLARVLKVMLVIHALLALGSFLSSGMQLDLLSRPSWTQEEGIANDNRERIAGLVMLVWYILTAVIFARWILLANRNVRAFGATRLELTPGWAVGYFFVPILNFWIPFRGMRQLWQASHSPKDWQDHPKPALVAAWWGFWLANGVMGQFYSVAAAQIHDRDSGLRATELHMFNLILMFPLVVLAYQVVARITAAQVTTAAEVTSEPQVA